MLPNVPFSLLAGLLFGLLCAWAARSQFRDGRTPWGRELRAVLSYQVLIRWPLVTYFFLAHREWSFLYAFDGEHLPLSLLLVILPIDGAALVAGYLGGWSLLRRRGELVLQASCWVAAIGYTLLIVVGRDRLFYDGDYAALHAPGGQAVTLQMGRLAWLLLVATVGAGVAGWEVYRTLVSESRRRAHVDQETFRRR